LVPMNWLMHCRAQVRGSRVGESIGGLGAHEISLQARGPCCGGAKCHEAAQEIRDIGAMKEGLASANVMVSSYCETELRNQDVRVLVEAPLG
jgi:hypothetical protein